MKLDERLKLLALRRQRLVSRAAQQREAMQLHCHAIAAPLQAVAAFVARWRRWLAPVALVGAPLGVLLGRRVRLGRVARLALAAWPLVRSVRHWLKGTAKT